MVLPFPEPVSSNPNFTSDGTSTYAIVVSDTPDYVEEFASLELQKYLRQITGNTISIKRESEAQGMNLILVGKTKVSDRLQISLLPRFPLDDAFIVQTLGNMIILQGCAPRSTLFAVYKFLEILGCRFYAPALSCYGKMTGEYVPKRLNLPLPEMNFRYDPAFKWRRIAPDFNEAVNGMDSVAVIDWAAKNMINIIDFAQSQQKELSSISNAVFQAARIRGLGTVVHLNQIFPFMLGSDRISDHPEWMKLTGGFRQSLLPGSVDLSNGELKKAMYNFTQEKLAFYPQLSIIRVEVFPSDKYPSEELQLLGKLLPGTMFEVSKTPENISPLLEASNHFKSIINVACKPDFTSSESFMIDVKSLFDGRRRSNNGSPGLIFVNKSENSLFPVMGFVLGISNFLDELRPWGIESIEWSPQLETWGSRELEHYLFAASMFSVGLDYQNEIGEYGKCRFGGSAMEWINFFHDLSKTSALILSNDDVFSSDIHSDYLLENLESLKNILNIRIDNAVERHHEFFLKKQCSVLDYLIFKSVLKDKSAPDESKEEAFSKIIEMINNPVTKGWIERQPQLEQSDIF